MSSIVPLNQKVATACVTMIQRKGQGIHVLKYVSFVNDDQVLTTFQLLSYSIALILKHRCCLTFQCFKVILILDTTNNDQ